MVGESLVWTDWGRPGLQRADRTTGTRQPALPYMLSHIGKPYGVAVAGPACPRLTNTCQVGQPRTAAIMTRVQRENMLEGDKTF